VWKYALHFLFPSKVTKEESQDKVATGKEEEEEEGHGESKVVDAKPLSGGDPAVSLPPASTDVTEEGEPWVEGCCKFYIKRKRRYCRMRPTDDSSEYCSKHEPDALKAAQEYSYKYTGASATGESGSTTGNPSNDSEPEAKALSCNARISSSQKRMVNPLGIKYQVHTRALHNALCVLDSVCIWSFELFCFRRVCWQRNS
jgi:hypothetical protein